MRIVAFCCGLAFAAGMAALLAWMGVAASPVRDPRLGAAVRVLSAPQPPARVARVRTQRAFINLPLAVRFDRERAVRLAITIDGADTTSLARRLASYLKTGQEPGEALACAFLPESAGVPQDALRAAAAAPSWAHAQAALTDRYGLSEGQMSAVRCALCREALDAAFDTMAGPERARKILDMCVALAPAQGEAVLGVQAALELLRAGPQAEQALDALARARPELAALLRQARRRRD